MFILSGAHRVFQYEELPISGVTAIRAVPYSGHSIEKSGDEVWKLRQTSATSTLFNMARDIYNFSTDALIRTDTFTTLKLDSANNGFQVLMRNSASYMGAIRNAAGSGNVSNISGADGNQISRPQYPSVGTTTYYSLQSQQNGTVIYVNAGKISAASGNVNEIINIWNIGDTVAQQPPISLSPSASVVHKYYFDESGQTWIKRADNNTLLKYSSSYNLLYSYVTSTLPNNVEFIVVEEHIITADGTNIKIYKATDTGLTQVGSTVAGGGTDIVYLGNSYFTVGGYLYRIARS